MLEEKNDDRTSRGMPSHKLLLPIIFNINGRRSQNLRGQAEKNGICNPHFDDLERNETIVTIWNIGVRDVNRMSSKTK